MKKKDVETFGQAYAKRRNFRGGYHHNRGGQSRGTSKPKNQ